MVPSRNKFTRRGGKVLAAMVACGFVFGPFVAGVLGMHSTSMENRPLAQPPKASQGWEALDGLTVWADDNLPTRNLAVHANNWVDYHALGELPPGLHVPGKTDPLVVRGRDGYLFLGEDFTRACELGDEFDAGLDGLLSLARIIKASGRNVLVVVAPNKSSVATQALPRAVPRGSCALDHMRAQEQRLSTESDPLFVNVLPALRSSEATGQLPYWRTDTHWSHTGAAIYAKALAEKLSPALARRLDPGQSAEVRTGDLATMIGVNLDESAPMSMINPGTVHLKRLDPKWERQGVNYGPQQWTTTPAAGLVQGKTLLLGDSFNYFGAVNLQPLFAQGTLLWIRSISQNTAAAQIAQADTVIIEIVQRSVTRGAVYGKPAFQAKVKKALAAH